MSDMSVVAGYKYILSKNKKYPGNSFHARVKTIGKSWLSDACLEALTIWLCDRAVRLRLVCQY